MTGPERTSFDKLRTPPDEASQAPVWTDDGPIDPAWAAPPDPDPPAGGGRRRLITVGSPVLAVVVLLGAVFAFGGFKPRNDTITDVELGKTFLNGAYEFSFSTATVQNADGFGKYKRIQKVVVTGTMRNTSDESADPSSDWFLARGVHHTQIQTGDSTNVGKTGQFYAPQDVTPGLPPVRITVEFEFPPTFTDTELVMAMRRLTYGNHSYFGGNTDQFWDSSGPDLFRLRMPLKRLAAEKY